MPGSIHKHTSDEELIFGYRTSGDTEWLGCLLERYTTLLFGVAFKYLKDKTQAQDAVQQVFVKVLTAFPKEEILNFKGWLYILMRNHCLGVLRAGTRMASDEILVNIPQQESLAKEDFENDELQLQELHKAINTLPEEQGLAIKLFYLEKLSYKQIMERTNFTFEQVKSFIQNGKRNLKITLLKIRSARG